jgi:hypothetical protein
MKEFGIIDADLKLGYEFSVETIDKEDFRTAKVSISEIIGKYIIYFNGKIIHSCKTFSSVIYRLNELDKKFPLENESEIV